MILQQLAKIGGMNKQKITDLYSKIQCTIDEIEDSTNTSENQSAFLIITLKSICHHHMPKKN